MVFAFTVLKKMVKYVSGKFFPASLKQFFYCGTSENFLLGLGSSTSQRLTRAAVENYTNKSLCKIHYWRNLKEGF
jgi:hypothetical protein